MPNRRFAQMPPMPMGAPPPGVGGPPMPPMGGGPPPMAAPTGPPPRQEISAPLDSIGKILYDADVNSLIDNHPDMDANEIALKVWQDYGGDENGIRVDGEKVGKRDAHSAKLPPEESEKEFDATEDRKWERLPEGKTIADFVKDLGELSNMMEGTVMGQIKNMAKQNAGGPGGGGPGGGGPGGPPPGGGGPPPDEGGGGPPPGGPAASRLRSLTRLASRYDREGRFAEADFVDRHLIAA